MLSSYVPDRVYLLDMNQQMAVNIAIEPHVQKKVACNEGDITVKGKKDRLKYKLSIPAPLSVTASGLAEDLEGITISDLKPILNVEGYELPGEYDVKLQFEPKNKIKVAGEYTVKLIIEDDTPATTEEN